MSTRKGYSFDKHYIRVMWFDDYCFVWPWPEHLRRPQKVKLIGFRISSRPFDEIGGASNTPSQDATGNGR